MCPETKSYHRGTFFPKHQITDGAHVVTYILIFKPIEHALRVNLISSAQLVVPPRGYLRIDRCSSQEVSTTLREARSVLSICSVLLPTKVDVYISYHDQ